MSFLKTTCDECGEIELPVSRVLLRLFGDDSCGVCVLRCPECGVHILKAADEPMTAMLLAVGIGVSMWSAESRETPRDLSEREPISYGELEDFRLRLLQDDDILRHLAAN